MTNEVLNISVLCVFCCIVPFAILACIEEFRLSRTKRLLFEKALKRFDK